MPNIVPQFMNLEKNMILRPPHYNEEINIPSVDWNYSVPTQQLLVYLFCVKINILFQ